MQQLHRTSQYSPWSSVLPAMQPHNLCNLQTLLALRPLWLAAGHRGVLLAGAPTRPAAVSTLSPLRREERRLQADEVRPDNASRTDIRLVANRKMQMSMWCRVLLRLWLVPTRLCMRGRPRGRMIDFRSGMSSGSVVSQRHCCGRRLCVFQCHLYLGIRTSSLPGWTWLL